MDAYVGAVFVGGGFNAVLSWITALVDPQSQQAQFSGPDTKRFRTASPMMAPPSGMGGGGPVNGSNAGPYGGGYNTYQQQPPFQQPPAYPSHTMPPPPPPGMPPPLPPSNPLAPAQPQSAFLPLFNQTAQQRRLEVQYLAQFSGPPHAGRWTVQCLGLSFE